MTDDQTTQFVPTPPVDNEFTQTLPLVLADSDKLEPARMMEDLMDELEIKPSRELALVKDHFDDQWNNSEFITEWNSWVTKIFQELDDLNEMIENTTIYSEDNEDEE